MYQKITGGYRPVYKHAKPKIAKQVRMYNYVLLCTMNKEL